MSHRIIILTGEIQTGKTTLLKQFCLKQNNVAGILTPVVNGKRMFYDIEGKEFFDMESSVGEDSLAVGKYLFSATAFAKAATILWSASKKPGIHYLVIDEIGPLEIKQQKGLYKSLKKILQTSFNHSMIIVVRGPLVAEAITIFNLNNAAVLTTRAMKAYFELTA